MLKKLSTERADIIVVCVVSQRHLLKLACLQASYSLS